MTYTAGSLVSSLMRLMNSYLVIEVSAVFGVGCAVVTVHADKKVGKSLHMSAVEDNVLHLCANGQTDDLSHVP